MSDAIEQIYDQLAQVFGGTNPNQIFTMQMPGTSLDVSQYSFLTTGEKPATVKEKESNLVDQMFDIAKVSGGPNGQRVSSQYLQALSVLIPNFNRMMPEMKKILRDFINTPAPIALSGAEKPGTLAEVYFRHYEDWIATKQAWELKIQDKKDALESEFPKDAPIQHEKFVEWYSEVAEGELAKIDESMGKVLAIFSPADMDAILGALAAGPGGQIAEAVNLVKDLRQASPSGGYFYPVDLLPTNWFLDLTSDLDPVDLLKDPEFIAATITTKRNALVASLSQIQEMIDRLPPADAVKKAASDLAAAQKNYTSAQKALQDLSLGNTLTAVQIAIAQCAPGASEIEATASALKETSTVLEKVKSSSVDGETMTSITDDQLKDILTGYSKILTAQSNLLTATQDISEKGLELAATESASFIGLQPMLARLQSQLEDIQSLQSQLNKKSNKKSPPPEIQKAYARADEESVNNVLKAANEEAGKSGATSASLITAIKTAANSAENLKPLVDAAKNASATAQDVIDAVQTHAKTIRSNIQIILDASKGTTGADANTNVQNITNTGIGITALKKAASDYISGTPGASAEDLKNAITTAATTITNNLKIATDSATGETATAVKNKVNAVTATGPEIDDLKNAANSAASTPATPQKILAAVQETANAILRAPKVKRSDISARFMELEYSFTSSEMSRSSTATTDVTNTHWSTDLFFGSASGSTSSSRSVNSSTAFEQDTEIKIGLKAAKVDIERGWLDPGLFKLTGDMMSRLSSEVVSKGALPIDKTTKTRDWSEDTITVYNKALFPTFPVAFLIVKDVTISFQASTSQTDAVKAVIDSRAAAGGGFLCFSASSSSASHSDQSALCSNSNGQVITIHMPGPQILGWFLEFTPPDLCAELTPQAADAKAQADEISIINFVEAIASLNKDQQPKPVKPA